MKNLLINSFREFLLARGYQISKRPNVQFPQLSVFDLAISLLMSARDNKIRFLQVGANDGVYGDSIYRFVSSFPWEGILVEPQPEIFEKLKRNYQSASTRLIFENSAIGRADRGDLTLFRPNQSEQHDGYPSSIASFNRSAVAAQMKTPESEIESISVPCVTIDAMLARHGWKELDLLLIDTEGLDLEVLQSISLSKCAPLLIQLEHGHLSPAEINDAVSHLADNHYEVLYGGHYVDTIAVHRNYWKTVNRSQLSRATVS